MSQIVGIGTAQPAHVLTGATFTSGSGANQQGAMSNNGGVTLTPSGTGTVQIPQGYHDGTGKVAQVTVPAANVLAGTTIAGVAGTMPENGALGTITPGTAAKNIPAGHTTGGNVAGDANLVPGNILNGKSIFGVAGNVTQKLMATGSGTTPASGGGDFTVSGLSFTPRTICVWFNSTSATYLYGTAFYSAEITPFSSVQQGEYARGGTSSGLNTTSNAYVGTLTFNINSNGFSITNNSGDGFYNNANVRWVAYG